MDIDECKGNHSCHEDANCKEVRSWMIYFLVHPISFCSYNVFCAPVGKQEQFIAYALDSLCCTKVRQFEKKRFDLQVQPENRMKPKNCKLIFHFFHRYVHV